MTTEQNAAPAAPELPADRHWVYEAADRHRQLVLKMPASLGALGSDHIGWMIGQVAAGKMSPTKACRWLGWIQAALCAAGVLSLDEAKAINKAASDSQPAPAREPSAVEEVNEDAHEYPMRESSGIVTWIKTTDYALALRHAAELDRLREHAKSLQQSYEGMTTLLKAEIEKLRAERDGMALVPVDTVRRVIDRLRMEDSWIAQAMAEGLEGLLAAAKEE